MKKSEVKHISSCFIKPKHNHNNVKDSWKPPIYLTPWDLSLISIHYNQKGLLFSKPKNQNDFSMDKLLESLKDSLALTLVHFYPLAGRLATRVDQEQHECVIFIDCNKGPGIGFIHATLDMTISDIVSPVDIPLVVHSLFDFNDWRVVNYDGHTKPLLSIQVTELIDGVFIGCSMNHAVADGTSFWHFWNVWSEIHRAIATKEDQFSVSRPPSHARWFPNEECCRPIPLPFIHPDEFIRRYEPPHELKDRVFHLSSDSIARLKIKANEDMTMQSGTISSFQALIALVWRSIVRAKGIAPNQLVKCQIAANNRHRLDPPLAQEYFGNSVQVICTTVTTKELLERSLGWVAQLLHQSVANHNDKGVRSFLKEWVESPFVVDIGKVTLDSHSVKIGSSPRFDIYGNVFAGLGKSLAVRSGFANRYAGKVNTHQGCQGKGSVDLEICLMPDSMAALELDQEFMAAVFSTL